MRATYYTLDGGRKTRYTGPVAIAKSGDHELDYWSVDKAGNVERTRTLGVKVDVTAPVTKAQLSGPVGEPGFYRDDVTVGLDSTDAQSGVASSEIGVDGAPLAKYDGPIVVSAAGTHEVAFRSTDVTGRREKTKTVTFTIDRTAPTLGDPGAVAPSAGQFSPNGDGLADTVAVSHALTERGAVRLVVTPAAGGAAVRTVTIPVAKAGPGSITWDGRDDDGAYVPDGDYALTLTPLDRARNAGPSQAVTVTVFGAFVGLAPSPARFYPQDGDTLAPQAAATFRLKRGASVELKVLNAKGVVVRTITDTFPAGTGRDGLGRPDRRRRVRPAGRLPVRRPGQRGRPERDPHDRGPRRGVRAEAVGPEPTPGRQAQGHDRDGRTAQGDAEAHRPPAGAQGLRGQADEGRGVDLPGDLDAQGRGSLGQADPDRRRHGPARRTQRDLTEPPRPVGPAAPPDHVQPGPRTTPCQRRAGPSASAPEQAIEPGPLRRGLSRVAGLGDAGLLGLEFGPLLGHRVVGTERVVLDGAHRILADDAGVG